jgi:hypothetical protein
MPAVIRHLAGKRCFFRMLQGDAHIEGLRQRFGAA